MQDLRALGLKLLDYHGGQGTALYAVGSSWFAGRAVPIDLVEDAAAELRRFSAYPSAGRAGAAAQKLAMRLDAMVMAAKKAATRTKKTSRR